MSTCPEKSLHSVYLDGELPPEFEKEYLSHVASCPKCQQIQNSLKNLHLMFQKDSQSLCTTQEEKDKAFERLNLKMSYAKVTGLHTKQNSSFIHSNLLAIAAAAVFAVGISYMSINRQNFNSSTAAPLSQLDTTDLIDQREEMLSNQAVNELLTQNTKNKTENLADYELESTQKVNSSPFATNVSMNSINQNQPYSRIINPTQNQMIRIRQNNRLRSSIPLNFSSPVVNFPRETENQN